MSKIIGITGGIGSGKSVVCKVFAALGVPVYNADERAKWLIVNDIELKSKIILLLGEEAYLADGSYNKTFVAAQVFGNPEKLQRLNALVHPCVYADTERWVLENSNARYVIKEAALLSKHVGTKLDRLVVVASPQELRIERIKKRDPQRSEAEIKQIMARQTSDEDFLKMADFVIHNDEKQLLIPQIFNLHKTCSKIL